MNVYVETNFLVELVLEQEQYASCEELLRLAESRAITLAMPAFSWTEARETLRRRYGERLDLQKLVEKQSHEGERTRGFGEANKEAFAKVAGWLVRSVQDAEQRLVQNETRLFQVVRFLPLDAAVASEVSEYIRDYALKPFDATVLASVVRDLRPARGPACFLNKNTNDFMQPPIVELLKQRNCKLMGWFGHGVSYVMHVLGGGNP